MATKERIHRLVDQLPERSRGAERVLADPLLRALLTAPDGEEPLTAEEISGILEAKRDAQTGRTRRFRDVDELIDELNSDGQA
jgi:hypothetical protein